MRLFGRGSEPGEPVGGVADFWVWWAEARPKIDSLLVTEDVPALAEVIAPAVAALDPGLTWDVVPGKAALRALVVSAAGNPELRPLAHRWALAAPPSDALWEFHPSRPANRGATEMTLDVGGREFALDKLVLGLRVPNGTPRIDVTAFHPIFPDLTDEVRTEATLLALDWILGEDEVARWVGDIVAATFQPLDAVPAVHLPAVVADLASEYQQEQWALMEGRTAGGARLVATARYPLRPVDHPLLDQHIEITLPYTEADEDGLPEGASAAALREFEERLAAGLEGLGGTALLAAHMSAEGTRVLHVYADPSAGAAALAEELAASWDEGRAQVESQEDPGWIAISPFLS
ncbi:DUF695 domain-containing protein [Sphaerisporangium corydalis]|uniref:DUF695 domain-containing protein n=1 Tax=Sphaerisporangium corydalis TaxID=1441875 RepID=A0ABV9EIJ0_9ACTN|nr:DUF695 domain-containing protein [Sphaerisporangium corydalis]